jgi:hypothetical protein
MEMGQVEKGAGTPTWYCPAPLLLAAPPLAPSAQPRDMV